MATYTVIGATSATATATTLALTLTAAVAIGDLIVVRTASHGINVLSIADNGSGGSNTYSFGAGHQASTAACDIWSAKCTHALSIGSVITVTFTATVTNRAMDALIVPGGVVTTPFDGSDINDDSTAAVTGVTPITPTTTSSIAVEALSSTGNRTATPQAGFTEDTDSAQGTTNHFETQTKILTTTSAVDIGGTLSTTGAWAAAMVVYKVAGTSPANIALNAGSSSTSGSMSLTAQTKIALNAGSSSTSGSVALTAATVIPLNAASSSTMGSLLVTLLTQIPLNAGASSTTGHMEVDTTAPLPLSASASTTTSHMEVDTIAPLPLAAGASTTSGTMILSAGSVTVPLASSSSTTSGTMSFTVLTKVPLNAGASTTSGAMSFTSGVSPDNVKSSLPLLDASRHEHTTSLTDDSKGG